MAFDFRKLDLKKQFTSETILIDKLSYDPMTPYSKAREILFENNLGKVLLTGYFDLSQLKIPQIVKIQKYSVKFDSKFTERSSAVPTYQSKRILITLNSLPFDREFLNMRELNSYLKQISAEILEIEGKICINLKNVKDVDFSQFLQLYNAGLRCVEENLDLNRSYYENAPDQEDSKLLHKISQQKRKLKNEYGEYKSFDDEKESVLIEEKNNGDILIDNRIEEDSDFINFEKDETYFDFDLKILQDKEETKNFKFVDPFHLKTQEKLKRYRKTFYNNSFKVCFNPKGEFITLGKFNSQNFRTNLNVNKIIPNKALLKTTNENRNGDERKELNYENKEFYQKSTLLNYLNILNIHLKEKIASCHNNSNQINFDATMSPFGKKSEKNLEQFITDLSINDYTDILDEYIRDLINFKSQIRERRQDKITNRMIEKFEREIETLKLFKVLFLNCFKSGNCKQSHENEMNQIKSQREEVKRMRKKKLTDWLVENINLKSADETKLKQNIPASSNNQIFAEIFRLLLVGKIRKAIDLSNRNGLFNLSMILSNTNPFMKSKTIQDGIKTWQTMNIYQTFPQNLQNIYNLLAGQETFKDNRGKEILTSCNWKQLLLSLSLYSMDPVKDISQLVHEFDSVLEIHKNLNNLSPNAGTNKNINDINYILIKIRHAIENNQTAEISKLTNNLTNTYNIFDEFTDSHFPFILITILLNTLENSEERFPIGNKNPVRPMIDFTYLKHLHLSLLIKTVEELLIVDGETEQTNWKYAINLVNNSNVPLRFKKLICDEIIFRKIEIAKDDEYFINNVVDSSTSNEAIGLYNYYRFNFKDANSNFKKSKNFNKVNEIFIFHFLCLRILENNVNNATYDEMNMLSNYSVNCNIWEKYGTVFHQYLVLLRKLEGDEMAKLDLIDIGSIGNLIKKVDAITTYNDVGYKKLMILCRNKILTNLRRLYNLKADLMSNKNDDMHIYIMPSLSWVRDSNLNLEIKMNEFISSLESQIKFKSKVFQDLQ